MGSIWFQLFLSAVTLSAVYITGSKKWWGWGISLGVNLVWYPYYVITEQWGLMPMQLGYTIILTRNLVKWYREAH